MQIPMLPIALDWEQLVIFLFIIGSSLLGRLMQANQNRRNRPARPPAPQRPPGQAQPFGGQPPLGLDPRVPVPANPQERLEQEIEAFLRKAAPNRKRPQTATPPAVPGQPPPVKSRGTDRAPVKKQQTRALPSRQTAQARAADMREASIRSGVTVEAHVKQHVGQNLPQPQLAAQVEQSDERVEDRLHEVFDHSLGNLSDSQGAVAQGTDANVWDASPRNESPLADQLRGMLTTPSKVGAAIVLSEILRRPVERWDDQRWNDPLGDGSR